jgi:hypothetical protein
MMPPPSRRRAFHLGTTPAGAGLGAIAAHGLIPALAARYRDLSALRYDYPVVLLDEPCEGEAVRPLSRVIDDLLRATADQDAADRIAAHVLALERQLRQLASRGERGLLSGLWERTASELAADSDLLRDSLRLARSALTMDGEVVDCQAGVASRILRHGWEARQREKGRTFRAHVERLVLQLSEILRAASAYSAEGRTSAALRASIGGPDQAGFDFDLLAKTLAGPTPAATIPDARRRRLEALTATLTTQAFYPAAGEGGLAFAFDSCAAAVRAYRERLPGLLDLVRAVGAAELEAADQYSDARHDAFFDRLAAGDLDIDGRDLDLFPDYFVHLTAASLTPEEHTALVEMLDSRLPIKVVLELDDVLPASIGDGSRGRARSLAQVAASLGRAFVLQAPASHLMQMRKPIARGLARGGPALFSVYAGTAATLHGLPPYLAGALALESRMFPALTVEPDHHPGDGRLDLTVNPQREADWPVYELDYEDDAHARLSEPVALTAADLLACDGRHAPHFAVVPSGEWSDDLVPLSRWLTLGAADRRAAVPVVLLVDADNRLQRAIVDAAIARETEACLERWRSLRRLAGASNADTAAEVAASAPAVASAGVPQPLPPAEPVVSPPEGRETGAAYIETPRCSSCNECIQLNGRMFKYNENKQAYIADASAGTFRELVEAAESCQVSIIHPGLPLRPDEPGLDALLERAAAFS